MQYEKIQLFMILFFVAWAAIKNMLHTVLIHIPGKDTSPFEFKLKHLSPLHYDTNPMFVFAAASTGIMLSVLPWFVSIAIFFLFLYFLLIDYLREKNLKEKGE